MSQRISSHLLYRLRNEIPISNLIDSLTDLSGKQRDGKYRFACPQCRQFDTAINTETNLARCFSCSKNYNTIDLMMQTKNVTFREAVAKLIPFLKQHRAPSPRLPNQTRQTHSRDSSNSLLPIREILEIALNRK